MKVMMVPHLVDFERGMENGIKRVVEAYFRYLPDYGVELVAPGTDDFDIIASHAGITGGAVTVSHIHGLYWTADYPAAGRWQYRVNAKVVDSIRHAKEVTVPSSWVAETFQRDMRFSPHVIPHGIDYEDWLHGEECQGYVLWNKNRAADVCHPGSMVKLALGFPDVKFVTTLTLPEAPENVTAIGLVSHADMKKMVQRAAVYLSTTKETFGIGTLEAMASGIPVLGFAQGGNLNLVEHAVNGYLAEPNNYEDLAEGLVYCLEHRKILGRNGQEMAKRWTWEAACEKVAGVYRLAMVEEDPTVAVVIPSFNYADKVGRAIESAINQTYEGLTEIIVVDDGSPDDGKTQMTVEGLKESYRLRMDELHKRRDEVEIELAEHKDDDDEMEIELTNELNNLEDELIRFGPLLENTESVKYVRQENSGVAIARNRGISEANTKYVCCLDADDVIKPGFLEPCVDALEKDRSLGVAYTRLEYILPDGERGLSPWPEEWNYDMQLRRRNQIPTCCVFRREMWERLGGYHQRFAPDGAGSEDAEFWLRSGACGYKARLVTDEDLFLYSWKSGMVSGNPDYKEIDWLGWQPYTQDKKHPFASWATPEFSSHDVRQYDEPIISVVIPVGPGHEKAVINALDSLEAQTFRKWEVIVVWDQPDNDPPDRLLTAYPYIRWKYTSGREGAGAARNLGASIARAPLLFFLDADDWLYPQALAMHYEGWQMEEAIIYSDYVGMAEVEDPSKLAPDLQRSLYQWDGKNAVIGYKSANYDCELAQRQPEPTGNPEMPYYHWCLVTCLIPKEWHDEIGGFDESMTSWEDVDYHWRMAKTGKCYLRIEEELLVYQFGTGERRDLGLQQFADLIQYLEDKYEEMEMTPCPGGCGGRQSIKITKVPTRIPQQLNMEVEMAKKIEDGDVVMIRYLHPNRGQHNVRGQATGRDYSYRGGGEMFLIERADAIAAPHLFEIAERPTAKRVSEKKPDTQPPPDLLEVEAALDESESIEPEPESEAEFDFQALPGVNADIAAEMKASGLSTREDVLALGEKGLLQYKHIGPAKAKIIIKTLSDEG